MNAKLITTSILGLLLATIAALILFVGYREALTLDGSIQLSILQQPVQIYFDKSAVPYIEARSEKDMLVAQGYITASQRLFQMDILRRIAKGETAAIFGSTCLSNDKLAHIVGFRRIAEQEFSLLSQETQQWLRSYCQGVNAYISKNKLPLEFSLLGYEPQPWQPEDSLSILKYLQYANDECWQLNILQDAISQKVGSALTKELFANSLKVDSANSDTLKELHQANINRIGFTPNDNLWNLVCSFPPAAQRYWGSNGWIVPAQFSKSGAPLIACDKDSLFSFPDLFYLSSLRAPFIHIAGITIPGVPGILMGRNDKVSWSAISLKQRSQELCMEQFSEKLPDQYQNSTGSFKAKILQDEILNRFSSSRLEKITITRDGPILTKTGDTGIALSWYGLDPHNGTMETICRINRAQNWFDFSAALEKYRGTQQTFLYADTNGSTAEYIAGHNVHAGQVRLKHPTSSTNEHDNTQDFIVANSARFSVSSVIQNILNSTPWANGPAVCRISTLLDKSIHDKKQLGLDDLIAIQGDNKAPFSEALTSAIGTALSHTRNIDQYQTDAIDLLNKWDGQLRANSIQASLYESFLLNSTKKILQPIIGKQLTDEYINRYPYWTRFVGQTLSNKYFSWLSQTESDCDLFNLNCLSQSLRELRLIYQSGQLPGHMQQFQWQKLHQLNIGENIAEFVPIAIVKCLGPLIPGNAGLAGDQDCVNACNYHIDKHLPIFACNSGPTARLLIDMGDNDKFYHSLVFGQCGHIFSRDRINDNQLRSWQNMEYHAIAFSSKQLEKTVRHVLSLNNQLE